jgi:hypothetical protein
MRAVSGDWGAAENDLPTSTLRDEWREVVGGRAFDDLVGGVLDALRISPPAYVFSVFGQPTSWLPAPYSEFGLLYTWRLLRTVTYVADVGLPSVPLTAPAWFPEPLAPLFWHPSRIAQRPDHNAGWSSHRRESWFFVNGIMTNHAMSQLNAAYLADLFHRPITLVQNSTGGLVEDLLECALDKAFGRTGEAARTAVPPIYDALKDADTTRVVVVAHSQGTIVASVVLRFLALLYRGRRGAPAGARALAEAPEPIIPRELPLDPSDFEPLYRDELAKLELYCFANCATEMRYLDRDGDAPLPWIESYGNEFDIVARLGVLAPNASARGVAIDGPRYEHKRAWGHLLNQHYLRAIDSAQRKGHKQGPRQDRATPYVLVNEADHPDAGIPRLFRYLNGGSAPPRGHRAAVAEARAAAS